MIRIAILEDDLCAAQTLQATLNAFAEKNDLLFNIRLYTTAEAFLDDARTSHDIAFLDIELGGMSGMDAAFQLRERDQRVIIIFVTNMAQYAVKGYEVDALYYIIKPISEQSVFYKLQRALALLQANAGTELVLRQSSGLTRISTNDLIYVEITNHRLIYHTDAGAYTAYGSLSDVEKTLRPSGFFRCNSCYLVNARYIQSVVGLSLTLRNGTQLQISHPRKKQFMIDFGSWLGEGNT